MTRTTPRAVLAAVGPGCRLAGLLLLVLAGAAPPARADRLVPRSGKPIRGVLVSRTDEEVVFNPYWSRNPEMVYGLVRLAADRVRRVEVAPRPEVEVWRRLAGLAEGDADGLSTVAAYAAGEDLDDEAEMCWALALAADPEREEALAALGGRARWATLRHGNPLLEPSCADALREYVSLDDPTQREARFARLEALGLDLEPEDLERYRRAARAPRGYVAERPLSWHSDRLPGATYALHVPARYDGLRPWPLLVGLHGGGVGGKHADEVVGRGHLAMNFYRDLAERHGFLVVCPNALEAPWGTPRNEELVRALIQEMKHLYNVDVDRIHLTGHSMGGFGTWALGPRLAEDLAAISPMAGGGGGGIDRLVETRTPVFIYHSDDDYVSVESDRAAARRLLETDLDFVYTELPGKGHSLPDSVRHELFEFLAPRRRHDPARRGAWPRSSLHGKVTREEKTYLGDPRAAIRGEEEGLRDWIAHLRLGGGRAQAAVAALTDVRPPGAAKAVAKVLRDRRATFDSRAWAARALGLLGDLQGAAALRRALRVEPTRDEARVVREAARALVAVADVEGGRALGEAVEAWCGFYEDRVASDGMDFADWERAVPTLAELVEAWADLPGEGDPPRLARGPVRRVLAPGHVVRTSRQVPQDPSVARTALARAAARAYARWGAGEEAWAELLEAVGADERARAAVRGIRDGSR